MRKAALLLVLSPLFASAQIGYDHAIFEEVPCAHRRDPGPLPRSDAEPTRPLCCGRTYLSQGLVDEAKVEAQRVMAALAPALAEGTPIVGLEP
ncbi:MAG TPA: hypothetical protein PL002_14995, partial [Flavobacteriales bacterium]|nr:hypothetical protein [Flavobacteriales bacterium]